MDGFSSLAAVQSKTPRHTSAGVDRRRACREDRFVCLPLGWLHAEVGMLFGLRLLLVHPQSLAHFFHTALMWTAKVFLFPHKDMGTTKLQLEQYSLYAHIDGKIRKHSLVFCSLLAINLVTKGPDRYFCVPLSPPRDPHSRFILFSCYLSISTEDPILKGVIQVWRFDS